MAVSNERLSHIIAIISLYWTVSISLVFVNKRLLHTKDNNADISLFICWYQTLSGTFMLSLYLRFKTKFRLKSSLLLHPKILSLSVLFVSGLVVNMLMLKYIGVAFYQVARSTTLIFVVIFSYLIIKKSISMKSAVCCVIVVLGFLIGADQEALSVEFSLTGVSYGILASFIIGLTSVFMKLSQEIKLSSVELTFYYNATSCVIMTILMITTRQIQILSPTLVEFSWNTWAWLTYSGLLSIGMGWTSTLQIQYTSPMTHHISISAKSTLQTVMAVQYFRETKGLLWWFGTLLTITGTMMYAVIKIREESMAVSEPSKRNDHLIVQPSKRNDHVIVQNHSKTESESDIMNSADSISVVVKRSGDSIDDSVVY